jgi:hypothetical protein
MLQSTTFFTALFAASALTACVFAGHGSPRFVHHSAKTARDIAERAAQSQSGQAYHNPQTGTPTGLFAAQEGFPIDAIVEAATKKLTKVGATYPISEGSKTKSKLYTDWANFKNVSDLFCCFFVWRSYRFDPNAFAARFSLCSDLVLLGFCIRLDG